MTTRSDGKWEAWMMTAAGAALEHRVLDRRAPGAGEATVEVAGCGVCHTDLSFLHHGVKTRGALPLVLGHEISGTVREVGAGVPAALVGQAVVVPAVLPCGECDLCRAGRRAICRKQVMPGNDVHGGFASHVIVPARFLCPVPEAALTTHALWELAVVSDAVATPFEAVKRSGLAAGELALFIGVGGIGVYGVQIAAATGAKVVALDVDDRKLEQASAAGAGATLNVRDVPAKDVRKLVRSLAEGLGAPAHLWKIFEMSGTSAGQATAYSLLGFGASLAIVGYTMDKVEVCLSNLMAYDATVRGNWGADPLVYVELLQWIGDGRITVKPYVDRQPLERINAVFDDAHHGRLLKRAVMVP
ncbi:MAG: 6-hydroxycyclohex-1-ene-1-carbonyl-CoA dehydrogenase [Gemmatimonadetes bacterium]|nr:6-hydroxycyclohex-1-ene-1-carbonyl-CoA dehydrogenase [Gemmatimonadota bacterium]